MIRKYLLLIILFFIANRSFAVDSKLSNGAWHKISIALDGVYKLDYNFIKNNITNNPESISFSNFGVFGQGMGLLPEENSAERPDDLVEIGIKIIDQNNNGNWNNGDFVLFYGKGPDVWNFNIENASWGHTKNCYTDVSSYFITTNSGSGSVIPQLTSLPATTPIITTYDHWQFYEEEENNLLYTEQASTAGSGRVWYGELLNNISPTKTINFSVPNVVTSTPATIKSKFAAASDFSSTFSVKNNGSTLFSQSVGSIPSNQYPPVAVENTVSNTFMPSSNMALEVTFNNNDPQASGWIDYIELLAEAQLSLNGSWLSFRKFNTIDTSVIDESATFRLSSANSSVEIWDVTKAYNISRVPASLSGSQLTFTVNTDDVLRELVAVNVSSNTFEVPSYAGEVANQNLHAIENVDYIIITVPDFVPAAERLADLHIQTSNMSVEVVTIDEVYNEFSSGQPDLSAIRNFLKMLYDNGVGSGSQPKYCLLMGDASFDYKDKLGFGENFIPTYQSYASLNTLNSYATDDYIGFLDDHEGGNIAQFDEPDLLDIAIGRFPVSTLAEANTVVDKIYHYVTRSTFGDWRNNLTFVADDEDGNLHFEHAEEISSLSSIENRDYYNFDKIYIDSYNQINSAGGDRYPDVNNAILRKFFTGSFLVNYIGHGGPQNWAQERIFNIDDIRNLDNIDKLPVFLTATCDFSPFDDPGFHSAGETLLTNGNGGAIAMISTTRLVYASSNKIMNSAVMNYLFEEIDGRMPTIGEVVMQAKNITPSTENNRKFTLLGDPALTLAYPKLDVVTTEINGQPISGATDTLKALSQVTIKGEVQSNGSILTTFNGLVYPTVFDKPTTYQTRANDSDSDQEEYELQNNILFKGKSSVTNGEFEFTFIVPKDINYAFGNGRISYYAEESSLDVDAHGFSKDFLVGGTDESFVPDNEGPLVEVFINDLSFVAGGITDENPKLILTLSDESGINTVGTGVGHDITALLNLNTQEQFVLNDYYEAALDDFTKGTVTYPFNNLPDGRYRVDAKAWDVHNNPGDGFTEFVVVSSEQLAVQSLFNYPNPFTNQTTFVFEHNRPGEMLDITIQVFDYNGQLQKTITETIQPEGTRLQSELMWDGSNDFGAPLSKGAYIYRLTVRSQEGLTATEIEKLIILR